MSDYIDKGLLLHHLKQDKPWAGCLGKIAAGPLIKNLEGGRFDKEPPESLIGETFHDFTYIIVNADMSIPAALVLDAICTVPTKWGFMLGNYRADQMEMVLSGIAQGYLFPKDPQARVVTVIDGDLRRVGFNGFAKGISCCVCWRGSDTQQTLGLRIWHELLHCVGQPADYMLQSPGFDAWLPEWIRGIFIADKARYQHDPYLQTLYYTYLTEVHNGSHL